MDEHHPAGSTGRRPRRDALRLAITGLAATLIAGIDRASGQEATPGAHGGQTEFLPVQTFGAGTLEPAAGASANYRLTLREGVSRTLYFSDRPDRITGVMPTTDFLDVLASIRDDPPNAALVVEQATGDGGMIELIWVVTLLDGACDAASRELTYDLRILHPDDAGDTRFALTPMDAPTGTAEFSAGHLFIDGANRAIIVTNLSGRDITFGLDRE